MNLAKFKQTFSATTTADALLVVGHDIAAVNGLYTTSDNGTTYTKGAYTITVVDSLWQILQNGTSVASESAATARPQGGTWDDCSVMEASPLTVASSSKAITLSLFLSGGASGGALAQYEDGIMHPYTLEANEVGCIDAKQVFVGPATVYFGGTPGTSIQLSYSLTA